MRIRVIAVVTLLVLVLSACGLKVVTLEGTVIEAHQVFLLKTAGNTHPVYEFEYDGLRCLASVGEYQSGLWCERIERN